MLVDTSGTYAQEATKAQLIVNYLLGSLEPGDSLAVARVQAAASARRTSSPRRPSTTRPSQANPQKRAFREAHRQLPAHREVEPLHRHHRRADPGRRVPQRDRRRHKTIMVFSDMQEELDKVTGARHPDEPEEDPRRRGQRGQAEDRQRRSAAGTWAGSRPGRSRVVAAGASEWRVINDLERLEAIFPEASRPPGAAVSNRIPPSGRVI